MHFSVLLVDLVCIAVSKVLLLLLHSVERVLESLAVLPAVPLTMYVDDIKEIHTNLFFL
jgi:uncharacterized protein YsxB (DUF464 family)